MHFAVLLLVAGAAFAQYDTQPSGYGNNNPGQVQYVAGKSPKNKPVDYTKGGASDFPRGGSNIIGNLFNQQNLGQTNTQGQQNIQKGGDQTNVGINTNTVNVGQTNNQNVARDAPSSYKPVYAGAGATYQGPNFPGSLIKDNTFNTQDLGQLNNQGQSSVQKGGDQTNPSYDAPSYGGNAGYNAGGAIYVPDFSNFIKNNVNAQNLGQTNAQGQSNAQIGGAQTNVGQNQNAINVGQSNNQGGNAGKPSYDAPSYGAGYNAGGAIYVPDFSNFIKNNVNSQNLGQANNQGQTSVQKGGDQTNVGANQNAVNVGQSNNQGAGPAKGYDAPRYGGYNPGSFFAGNNIFAQNLGQTSNQGQSNAQVGGAQTNVGANQNEVNVGQSNNQGAAPAKGYDAPRPKYTSPPAQETGGYKSKLH
ncbi:unnamed protein product [Nippostrongylus brasiliensis]|uniref:Fibroin heavy chain-like n=1 Tax=Nippostrongylus brasiliensis TaxID=27835 RepID=A0A0N4YHI4_NIPBR|nr:unnamed protein product [Nippostrongylus brasiliensis]